MGHGGVAALAVYDDVQAVGTRHEGPGASAERPQGHFGPDVQAENGLNTVEDAAGNHGRCTAGAFLGGLENKPHAAS